MEVDIVCNCDLCGVRNQTGYLPEEREGFNFDGVQTDLKFPEVGSNVEKCNLKLVLKLINQTLPEQERLEAAFEGINYVTYLKIGKNPMPLSSFTLLCEELLAMDLNMTITESKLASEFLQKLCQVFTLTWHAFKVEGNVKAEWAARMFRTFLSQALSYPIIQTEVNQVFFGSGGTSKWPVCGPVQILELQCRDTLNCLETVSLMINLTRIENFCQFLSDQSSCVQILEEKFQFFCEKEGDCLNDSYYLLVLYWNVCVLEKFMKAVFASSNEFFPRVVIPKWIESSHKLGQKVIWAFFRSFAMTEDGRDLILETPNLFDHALYQLVPPPTSFPTQRMEDPEIKECVVDIFLSLCQCEVLVIALRDNNMHEILQRDHLKKEDNRLNQKISDLMNILIGEKDAYEMDVDNLLPNLTVSKNISAPVPAPTVVDIKATLRENARPMNDVITDDACANMASPCTGEEICSLERTFDYRKHATLNTLRMYAIQYGPLPGFESKNDTLSEKNLQARIEEEYGDVDLSEEFIKKARPVVEKSLMKIQTPSKEPSYEMLDYLSGGIRELVDTNRIPETISEILIARASEMELLLNVKPQDAAGDWFLLPRPAMEKVGKKFFMDPNTKVFIDKPAMKKVEKKDSSDQNAEIFSDQTLSTVSEESSEDKMEAPPKLLNLHLYDPKVQFVFDSPRKIFSQKLASKPSKRPENRLLYQDMLKILLKYPFGLSATAFYKKFKEEYDYLPFNFLEPCPLLALIGPEICSKRLIRFNTDVFYPQMAATVVDFDTFVSRLWHAIKCILATVNGIHGKEIFSELRSKHQVNFHPSDWGLTVKDFMSSLLTCSPGSDGIIGIDFHFSDDPLGGPATYWLIKGNCQESVMPNVDDEDNGIMTKKKFLVKGDYIRDCLMDPPATMLVRLVAVHHQTRLVGVLTDAIATISQEFQKMNKKETVARFYHLKPRRFNDIQIGMYMMAQTMAYDCKAWFRVRILSRDLEKQTVQVFGIDHGFINEVHFSNLRYMLTEFSVVPAYAIPFTFSFSDHYNDKYCDTPLKNPEKCRKKLIFHTGFLRLSFRLSEPEWGSVFDWDLGCDKWIMDGIVTDELGYQLVNNASAWFEKICVGDHKNISVNYFKSKKNRKSKEEKKKEQKEEKEN